MFNVRIKQHAILKPSGRISPNIMKQIQFALCVLLHVTCITERPGGTFYLFYCVFTSQMMVKDTKA